MFKSFQIEAVNDGNCPNRREPVHYSISNTTSSRLPFRIDETTGKICLQEKLDFETTKFYRFNAIASNNGKLILDKNFLQRQMMFLFLVNL